MAKRFAAASGLALATALIFAAPAKAQGFFSFYEMSPRQIVGMLSDDGYELRGPMLRRGDVYVADVSSVSGRSMRLIVSARDGRVIERFATAPRARRDDNDDEDVSRVARSHRFDEDADRDNSDRYDRGRHNDLALGDVFNPPTRVYGNDSLFGSKPTPPAAIPDDSATKPKHHVAKKHKDANVAKAPASDMPKSDAAKPADAGSAVATVTPSSPPEPKKPAVEPVKPAEAAKPAEPAPKPETAQAKVDEKRATAEPAPAPVKKVEPAKKKLNDLPVGTLD